MKRIAILLPIYLLLSTPPAPAQDATDSTANSAASASQPEENKQMLRAVVRDNELFGDGAASGGGPAQSDLHLRRDPMLDGQTTSTQPVVPMLPGSAAEHEPMRLNAQRNVDPDKDNRDVMLAWDKWRNHFAHSVWERYCQTLIGPGTVFLGSVPIKLINASSGYQFENGLHATYSCVVTNDRRIVGARIVSSSGNPQLDAIILQSVEAMAGKHSLSFPKGSFRKAVGEYESLGTGTNGWHGRSYGDIEHYAATTDK